MFEKVFAATLSLEPGFPALALVTFALFMTWFKRRRLARFVPSIAGDFLTRHIEARARRYPYGG